MCEKFYQFSAPEKILTINSIYKNHFMLLSEAKKFLIKCTQLKVLCHFRQKTNKALSQLVKFMTQVSYYFLFQDERRQLLYQFGWLEVVR